MTESVTMLRGRQAQQVRTAILDAAVAAMESANADDFSMAAIASAAGISLRTLYRYFPDRTALLQAAGELLYASLEVPFEIAHPRDIAASFRSAARRLSVRPKLARALVQSNAGRAARSAVRSKRVNAIRAALKPVTEGMDSRFARRADAIIAHLCSAASWVTVADESGLSDIEAQESVAWAIDTLVQALRQDGRTKTDGVGTNLKR